MATVNEVVNLVPALRGKILSVDDRMVCPDCGVASPVSAWRYSDNCGWCETCYDVMESLDCPNVDECYDNDALSERLDVDTPGHFPIHYGWYGGGREEHPEFVVQRAEAR